MSVTTRPAAVAGLFYPADAALLAGQVQALLEDVHTTEEMRAPKALIVPHAGYVYSGAIAASAYARLRSLRGKVRRVVLLGPVHRVPVRGLALPSVQAFATPLGEVPLDITAWLTLADLPQVVVNDRLPRPGTLAGGTAAVSAKRARRIQAGAAGGGRRHAGASGRGAGTAVGR